MFEKIRRAASKDLVEESQTQKVQGMIISRSKKPSKHLQDWHALKQSANTHFKLCDTGNIVTVRHECMSPRGEDHADVRMSMRLEKELEFEFLARGKQS
jgi:hypothetical protein